MELGTRTHFSQGKFKGEVAGSSQLTFPLSVIENWLRRACLVRKGENTKFPTFQVIILDEVLVFFLVGYVRQVGVVE